MMHFGFYLFQTDHHEQMMSKIFQKMCDIMQVKPFRFLSPFEYCQHHIENITGCFMPDRVFITGNTFCKRLRDVPQLIRSIDFSVSPDSFLQLFQFPSDTKALLHDCQVLTEHPHKTPFVAIKLYHSQVQ